MEDPVNISSSYSGEHSTRNDLERTASRSRSPQRRRQRGSSQKAMLSKALQKANTAVLLDNAANFEGAIEAYQDACELLQNVMLRSNGGDVEKYKLLEIRKTYLNRIQELLRIQFPSNPKKDKALPERPPSGQSLTPQDEEPVKEYFYDEEGEENDRSRQHIEDDVPPLPSLSNVRLPSMSGGDLNLSFEDSNIGTGGFNTRESEVVAEQHSAPLSAHPISRRGSVDHQGDNEVRSSTAHTSYSSDGQAPIFNEGQSTSWLDTIDESGASSPVSTHSKLSLYLGHSHHASNGTEAEFDAALDAAVEAAYDEGLEPAVNQQGGFYDDDDYEDHKDDDYDPDDVVSNVRRNIEIAKQRVREAEREAQAVMARGLQQRLMMDETTVISGYNANADYIDDEAEEEERLLEEMTKGYVMDDFEFNLHAKTALPRQSDSSTISGRTWGSSITSNSATAGTSLSTLAEEGILTAPDAAAPSKRLPPVPKIPTGSTHQPIAPNMSPSAGVRARRFSGSNTKQLKIDTKRVAAGYEPTKKEPYTAHPAGYPSPVLQAEPKTSLPVLTSSMSKPLPSGPLEKKGSFDVSAVGQRSSSLTRVPTLDGEATSRSVQSSPPRTINKIISAPGLLRKNTSSSSLAGMRARNMSVSTPDVSNGSPNTPSSSVFPAFDFQRQLANGLVPAMPTPIGTSFPLMTSKSLHLFDNDIHSPTTPGSPSSTVTNAPIPLEPCPESFLLRPFWLMRCLYQTIAHPRGGYLSTKLFIPREVWHVKNVRIRAIEDKISLCDLLTAALQKVGQVDTYDADAVLEEMQAFENILDQAQTAFSKKLGNEVGVQGALPLFKNANNSDESPVNADSLASRTPSQSSRSVLTSWRKLRSKSSAAVNNSASSSTHRDSSKGGLSMSTLPMTASPPSGRFTKRDATQLQLSGPNANYMGALARLFDAVQVLDQIARQVEDPGLKHSSPTHVGLELSTRHAAEFFGFYICRFALNDVGLLLDKYIKRGTEWVLV
ncbi:conserved hypothetical protein [Talaromyces stipitatus ATCC 10500]|uniref:MIT domain-containing protein n=1 Tax=Talaromyces stipitatus (strain ATCC 10500 / CBS 375.48 / QM 6759 / NRRL 1006) TaxID=441959 RepID=B8M0Z2_TALSN|nr:uncharacterized protein TSTA_090110 [Talaromyces stipitatus ATCC 10500]EED21772.1 conserved hypothetical protein [Talaromyces stipitatus ATCC 10500]